jgi:hypothetical protein
VILCKDGGWSAGVDGANQNGEQTFAYFGTDHECSLLTKSGITYWWAIGAGRSLTVHVDGETKQISLDLGADQDGQTITRRIP